MNEQFVQVLGFVAGICTAVSLIPQIVKIVKEKKAQDISVTYLFVLLFGIALWITYGIMRKDAPVIATNVLSALINITTIILGVRYKKQG
ncbi:MAG: SemiSWEET transporter [Bacteroidota bacterium]